MESDTRPARTAGTGRDRGGTGDLDGANSGTRLALLACRRTAPVPRVRASTLAWVVSIVASVALVSALHYLTNGQSVVLHEIFRRLYYVPIVVAAVRFGVAGGAATAGLATALYLPHVWLEARSAPEQYGELLLFVVVGVVTGVLADRLRDERDRYRRAAAELESLYADARARADERVRLERLATAGRLAAGLAHDIRNPLGGLQGCIEILEADCPADHPKAEFFRIARREIGRLNALATSFLEFASPDAPVRRRVELHEILRRTVRHLDGLAPRIAFSPEAEASPLWVDVDDEQLERALADIVRQMTADSRDSRVVVVVEPERSTARVRLDISPFDLPPATRAGLFEPFSSCGCGDALALATARRLIEQQGASLDAEFTSGVLRCVVTLARCEPPDRPRRVPTEVAPAALDLDGAAVHT